MTPAELAARVRERCPDVAVARGEVTAIVDRDDLLDALTWLRDDAGLSLGFCSSLTATDWPEADPRFWVAYELLSIAAPPPAPGEGRPRGSRRARAHRDAAVPDGELARARDATTSSASCSTATRPPAAAAARGLGAATRC